MYYYSPYCCSECPYVNLFRNSPDNQLSAESKDLTFKNDEISGFIRIPILKGTTDPKVLESINRNMEEDVLEFKRQMETAASENAANKKAQNKPVIPFEISNNYLVSYNKNNILSMALIYTEIINRIPYYIKTSYNYDLTSGKSLRLCDLFQPQTDYKKSVDTEINSILGNKTNFKGISDDQPFYLDGDNLVIFLGFNEIGLSPTDIPVIKIPFNKFPTLLKPQLLRET